MKKQLRWQFFDWNHNLTNIRSILNEDKSEQEKKREKTERHQVFVLHQSNNSKKSDKKVLMQVTQIIENKRRKIKRYTFR